MNVNLIFEKVIVYNMVVLPQICIKKQLITYSKYINKYKQNIVFLYGEEVKENDTISSLNIRNNDFFDVMFKTDKYTTPLFESNHSLVQHLVGEGFDSNKGVFYGENIWCATIKSYWDN